MALDWHGNVTVIIVAIAMTICFGWVPIVIIISIVQHNKRRFRPAFEARGGVVPAQEEEKGVVRQQKAPEIQKPAPSLTRPVERSSSVRTHGPAASYEPLRRWDTGSSWDPVRRWDTMPTADPQARPNSTKSNLSHPVPPMLMPSRASSIRSVANLQPGPGTIGSRSRRGSVSSSGSGSSRPYQVETAYYDTTPLPQPPLGHAANIARAQSARQRSTGPAHQRKGTSLDQHRRPSPGRKSEDYSRPRTSNGEKSIPMLGRTPPPRRASLNAPTAQAAQAAQTREAPWLEESQPLPHAM